MAYADITGQRFGRLTVTKFVGKNKKRCTLWECLCDCGKTKITTASSLRAGTCLSCGCLQREKTAESTRARRPEFYKDLCDKRGVLNAHGLPEYTIWKRMRQRCDSKNFDPQRVIYSKITVCPEWEESFQRFYEDMGPRPSDKHQIDRIDNCKGYFPENCHWVLPRENNMNKSDNRPIEWNGVTKLLCDWEKELMPKLGIKRGALWARLTNYGWSVERAFTTPHQKSGKSSNPKSDESDLANPNE
jgi:hypothetical protein